MASSSRLALLLVLCSFAVPAAAEPPPPKDWEVEITPYGWVPDLDGSVETRNGTEHFHVGMDDVLENLSIAAMGRVSVRWQRWVGVVDGVWSVLEDDDSFQRGPLQVDGDVRQTMVLAQALAGYRVYARPGGLFGHAAPDERRVFGVDVLAGANYTYVSGSVELRRDPVGPLGGNSRHFGKSNDWFAPAVGLRIQNDFTERLRMETLASVGRVRRRRRPRVLVGDHHAALVPLHRPLARGGRPPRDHRQREGGRRPAHARPDDRDRLPVLRVSGPRRAPSRTWSRAARPAPCCRAYASCRRRSR
jgi:hypothetical protein